MYNTVKAMKEEHLPLKKKLKYSLVEAPSNTTKQSLMEASFTLLILLMPKFRAAHLNIIMH